MKLDIHLFMWVNIVLHIIYDEGTHKFNINSEKDLTEFLNGMNQRCYTTEIDGEKRLANSITVVVY